MKNRFCFLFSGALSLGLLSCSNSTSPTSPTGTGPFASDPGSGAAFEVQTTVVDGRTYSYRAGGSGPTVVFEHGLGSNKEVWFQVGAEVATFASVFAYDRAGYGGSDPGPKPRDGARMVEEFRRVLQSTGRRPPYVIVGHSLGGTLMELYARTHPSEVSGVVLVDSRAADFGARCREQGLNCGDIELDAVPDPIRSELSATPETEKQVLTAPPAGAMPAIVLAHGRAENTPEYEALWRSSQEDLAASFPAGRLIIAEMSGHFIQVDEPHLVIDAVRAVIESSQ